MTDKEYPEFIAVLAQLAEMPGYQMPSKTAQKLYWNSLRGFSLEQIKEACYAHLNGPECSFFPKPGQLREHIAGDPESRAIEAWDLLLDNMDPYASVLFTDGALAATVETMGGWLKVCQWADDEIHWRRQEFMRFYQDHARRSPEPKRLLGRFERDNRRSGWTGERLEGIQADTGQTKIVGNQDLGQKLLADSNSDQSEDVLAKLKKMTGLKPLWESRQ